MLNLNKLKDSIDKETIDVDAVTITGMPLIHCAVFYRQVKVIQYLVAMGANLNATDKSGNTALHLALNEGSTELVHYLLECQASLNIPNALGQTPLHLAVRKNHLPLVSLLLKSQADVNLADLDGCTPIFHAKDSKIFQELLQAGTSLNHQNEIGQTPLMILVHRYMITRESTYLELLELAIQHNDINWLLVDSLGRTVYHHAVICHRPDLLKLILSRCPLKIIKIRDRQGETGLDVAQRLGYSKEIAIITKIIDQSTNPLTHGK